MKHKLLSLLALAGAMFMSTSAWAQDDPVEPTPSKWADPVKPTEPKFPGYEGNFVAPVAGGTYYIYNVGAERFLGAGLDWGTRVVVSNQKVLTTTDSQGLSLNNNFITPIKLEASGEYYYLQHLGTSASNKYLSHEGNASWIDCGADRRGLYAIVAQEDGTYLLTPDDAAEGITFGVDGNNLVSSRVAFTWTDLPITVETDPETGEPASSIIPWVSFKFVDASDAESLAEWIASYDAALAIYNVKVVLHATLDAADAAGVSEADINAAVAVYESETATEAEILAANTALQLAITLASATDYPVDITGVLQNPDFEYRDDNGDLIANGQLPPGWDITITGNNLGQRNRTDTNEDTGYSITNFIEAWASSSLGDGVIAQTVYGLPAGIYRLECDASICHDPASGDGSDIVGAGLFIQSGFLKATTPIGTPRLGVAHFTVDFDNDGGKPMTFGLYAEGTNANWLSADNFQLFYVGELTESPHYKNLKEYLETVTSEYNENSTYCSAVAKEQMNKAIKDAENITTDASDDECDAAYTALEEALKAVNASVAIYEELNTYSKSGGLLEEYASKTADNEWDSLSELFSKMQEQWQDAYTDGTFTDEQVTEAINSINSIIINWMNENPDAVKEGNDLTLLLQNADFEKGTYFLGWPEDEPGYSEEYGTIPGWTISSGNITQMKHVIETYHRKFDFNQTIKNMPAGVYDITVQGFVRHDDTATDQTIFYAGNLETQLMERSAQWSVEGYYNSGDGKSDPCGGANKDETITNSLGESVKVPNGMSGFYWWEQEENTEGADMDYANWQPGDNFYTNHIKAVLEEAGDFTIGLKSLGTTDWIIWDNFQIKYLGDGGELYAEMAEEKWNELKKVYESEAYSIYLTEKAKEEYTTIVAIDYTAISDLKGYNEYAAQCDALIAYIKEGTELAKALIDILADYGNRIAASTAETSDFENGLYSDLNEKLENIEMTDNDELKAAPAALAEAWTKCIMDNAAEGEFGNVTEVIYNPNYVSYEDETEASLNGWTKDYEDGVTFGNFRAADGVAEIWLPKGEGTLKQQIVGLSEGYYRLTVNGWYALFNGYTSAEFEKYSTTVRAYMFGESSEGRYVQPLKNLLAAGESDDPGQEGEGTFEYTDAEENVVTIYTPWGCASAFKFFQYVFADDVKPTELVGEDENVPTYRNTLDVHVGADGILTIGITNKGLYVEGENNDWAVFSNWTMSYLGTEAPDGIAVVDAKTQSAPAVIYTIDGRQAARLQRGLNIVRTAEGQVQKVLVK